MKDLIRKLICENTTRLGAKGGAKEILAHPFFKGLDVDNIRNGTFSLRICSPTDTDLFRLLCSVTPPFVPEVKDPTDSSNFDEVGEAEEGADPLAETAPAKRGRGFQGNELPFIGFTFNRNFNYGGSAPAVLVFFVYFLATPLKQFSPFPNQTSGSSAAAPATLVSSGSSGAFAAISAANETSKKLQGDLDQLQSKLSKTEKDLDLAKTSYEQQGKRITTLETTNKTLLTDLTEMTEQLTKAQQQAS